MKKLLEFLNKYGVLIFVVFTMIIGIQQCSVKNSVKRETKYLKLLVSVEEAKDSIFDAQLELLNHKLDSTLISNNAVVNANKATSNAISNQKQQQVVVKVVPQQVDK